MENTSRSVALTELIDEFKLETLYFPEGKNVEVKRTNVNRPGLALTGFYGHFHSSRIQIMGIEEIEYLQSLPYEKQKESFRNFIEKQPVAVVFTASSKVDDAFIGYAEEFGVPILRTSESTSEFSAALIASLQLHLAPCITRHGVLVEVYGEGILILGDSGVGKSETAIELVKRGHRLIADDAVEIRKVSAKTLVGSAPKLLRHFVELRGIGIVDVKQIFGMGAVKETEKIDQIINLEPWVQGKMYDRLGLDSEYTDIMGIRVTTTTIPVKPGRNLAVILEIAAMNNRQKKMGYNSAQKFNEMLMESFGTPN